MTHLQARQNVPVGTVADLLTDNPKTITRDWDTLVLPALRLDAEGCRVLRQIINNELPEMAEVRAEIAEDEAERLAHGLEAVVDGEPASGFPLKLARAYLGDAAQATETEGQ